MRSYLHPGDYLLWGTIAVLQLVLLAFAWRQKLRRHLPWYVTLLGYFSAKSLALMTVVQLCSYNTYLYVYYAGMAIEIPILIMVVYDFFRIVFEPRSTLPAGTLPKISLAVVCVILTGVVAAIWQPIHSIDSLLAFLRTAHRTTEFVVCCSLWCVVIFAFVVGIPWTKRVAGIASGFLFYLTAQTVIAWLAGYASQPWVSVLNRVSSVSYLVGLVFWVVALSHQDVPVEMPTIAELESLKAIWSTVSAQHPQRSFSFRSKA
jgi:hypothetical protein